MTRREASIRARLIDYPILVDGRSFSMLSYPLASVVAEKFEAMVALADINSRMKDFWDVAFLLENYNIPDMELLQALRATFQRRNTHTPASQLCSLQPSQALIRR